MKSTTKWAMGLAVLLAALLQQPCAWGQLRTKSGAGKSGIEHPKELERRVFQLTNEARRKNGLPNLDQDSDLTTIARGKSDDMIQRNYFSHRDSDGKTSFDKAEPAKIGKLSSAGENIHMGHKHDYSDTNTAARLIVDGFMVSPGHRSNILNPKWTHLGVGVSVKGKDYYVTQSFGQMSRGDLNVLQKIGGEMGRRQAP